MDSGSTLTTAGTPRPVTVRELMTKEFPVVGLATGYQDLVVTLLRTRTPALLVMEGHQLVGIVTEADLLARPAFAGLPAGDAALRWENNEAFAQMAIAHLGLKAADIMSRTLISVDADQTAIEAAQVLMTRKVRVLPVMEGGRAVGLLTRRDILTRMGHTDEFIRARTEAWLRASGRQGQVECRVRGGIVTLTPQGPRAGAREAFTIEREVAALDGVVSVVWREAAGAAEERVPPTGPTA